MTDAQRVRQIIINLLANALKFTDEGEVILTVQATTNEVQIAVRDTGIGIPAHALKELFQDFHQLEAGDGRRYEGTGVGLALSRRLARALGGEIDVRSRRGRGLRVHARLAAHRGAQPPPEPSQALLAPSSPPPPNDKVLSSPPPPNDKVLASPPPPNDKVLS